MASFTVLEILDRARSAADMRDNFVTETEWLRWLKVEVAQLETFIAQTGYILKEAAQIITATGAAQYSLTEPLAILGVYELKNGRYRRLTHSDLMDGAGLIDTTTTGEADRFRVTMNTSGGYNLLLWPYPQTGTYVVMTIPYPSTIVDTATTVYYPLGWEERLVLGLARRALAKEESPTENISGQIREIEGHIERSAFDRIFAAHQKVRNVDKVERKWSDYPQIPSRQYWYFV